MESILLRVRGISDRIRISETTILIATAIIIGAGTGLGAVFFIWLIENVERLFFSGGEALFGGMGRWLLILIPAVGGLIAGPIIAFFASEAKGHGVPEVMQAIALRGGRIRPRVVVAKIAASAVCIGSGGSAGREGPIVQVGAALGSTLGQWLKLSSGRIRNLVACGAAAGIAATFNAPIAGVIFAMEVILGELHLGDLGYVRARLRRRIPDRRRRLGPAARAGRQGLPRARSAPGAIIGARRVRHDDRQRDAGRSWADGADDATFRPTRSLAAASDPARRQRHSISRADRAPVLHAGQGHQEGGR